MVKQFQRSGSGPGYFEKEELAGGQGVGGGVIGIGVAFAIDLGLRLFTNLQPVISWQIVVIASGVSLAVGIIFGTIPALTAARKDPIDALRSQ